MRQQLKLQGKNHMDYQVQLSDWYFMAGTFSLTWNHFLKDMVSKECKKIRVLLYKCVTSCVPTSLFFEVDGY